MKPIEVVLITLSIAVLLQVGLICALIGVLMSERRRQEKWTRSFMIHVLSFAEGRSQIEAVSTVAAETLVEKELEENEEAPPDIVEEMGTPPFAGPPKEAEGATKTKRRRRFFGK